MPALKLGFPGWAARFSPFYEGRIAVATSQHFGIVGNGRLHILDLHPSSGPAGPSGLTELAAFDTADGIYDCCWSELLETLAVAAVADGSLKLFDHALPPARNPVRAFKEHSREVHSVDWNPVKRDSFISGSWDDSVKLWTMDRNMSVRTFLEHSYCVYSVNWCPRHADVFASCSGDHTVKVWDVRDPGSSLTIPAHGHEVLSCDWSKYDPSILATGSVDKTVRVWDVRSVRQPLTELAGHEGAVRKVRFSPHNENVIISGSYDMTMRLWDFRREDSLLDVYPHHTEFTYGVDESIFVPGLFASTGWDGFVYMWQQGTDPRAGLI